MPEGGSEDEAAKDESMRSGTPVSWRPAQQRDELQEVRGWRLPVVIESDDPEKLLDYLSTLPPGDRVLVLACGEILTDKPTVTIADGWTTTSYRRKEYRHVLPNMIVAEISNPNNLRRLHEEIYRFISIEKFMIRTNIPQPSAPPLA